jgi:hypothetical protein
VTSKSDLDPDPRGSALVFWLPGSGSVLKTWIRSRDTCCAHAGMPILPEGVQQSARPYQHFVTSKSDLDPDPRESALVLAPWLRICTVLRLKAGSGAATLVVPMQECPYCQKEYNNLRDHIRLGHPKLARRGFRTYCPFPSCNSKTFSDIRSHIRYRFFHCLIIFCIRIRMDPY